MTTIKLARIYTQAGDQGGYRILVDRLWPRGISKANAHLDWWCKEVAPSPDLRKWFNHTVEKYPRFAARYQAELAANPAYQELKARVQAQLSVQDVILFFGAKDERHNQAVVLEACLVRDLGLPTSTTAG